MTRNQKSAQQNQHKSVKVNRGFWPIWLPYPISWLRAVVLVPIALPGTLFLFFFGIGIFLALDVKSPELSIFVTALGILLNAIFSALFYGLLRSWGVWLPGRSALWEGLCAVLAMVFAWVMTLICIFFYATGVCQFFLQSSISSSSCAGRIAGSILKGIWVSIQNLSISNRVMINNELVVQYVEINNTFWLGIWLISAAYLYQLEYCLQNFFNPQKLSRIIFSVLLGILVASGIYFFQKPRTIAEVPAPTTSPSPSLPPIPSPSPLPSETIPITPTPMSSDADSFPEAVRKANSASQLTQSAKSQGDWQVVASEWEAAIAFMKVVPTNSPQYSLAQTKILEYQRNLHYAQKNAAGNR